MEKGVLDINKNSLFVVAIYLGLVLFPPLVPDDLEFFKKISVRVRHFKSLC